MDLGHESLLDAGILHRDISSGNILLTEEEDDGLLIDFDLAIKLDNVKASGAPNKTGTKVFMSIGALYGEPHSFMHDLESIFWVLLWVCVHWDGPDRARRKVKGFDDWNCKPTTELAKLKIGMMSEGDKFQEEMKQNFSPYCKSLIPCMQELRKAVFPEGKRWLMKDKKLYSQIKAVLEEGKRTSDHIS